MSDAGNMNVTNLPITQRVEWLMRVTYLDELSVTGYPHRTEDDARRELMDSKQMRPGYKHELIKRSVFDEITESHDPR